MLIRLNALIYEYQILCFKVCSKYNSSVGLEGQYGFMNSVRTIRSTFIRKTQRTFRFLRKEIKFHHAYYEIKNLLKHPVAQELELMSEATLSENKNERAAI